MAYNEFAYFYDGFNSAANYHRLFSYIKKTFRRYGIKKGIIADLGCGTGELSIMLAKNGYDLISVDISEEMLNVLQEKLSMSKKHLPVLILNQDITALDFYGTVNGAVSTFDTFNHIPPEKIEEVIKSAAFFMEKGSVFIFDVNTEFKHKNILADNMFEIKTDEAVCRWKNTYIENENKTHIEINIEYLKAEDENEKYFSEDFYEYSYSEEYLTALCEKYGLRVVQTADGESFKSVKENSQRIIFTAVKQYDQELKQGE